VTTDEAAATGASAASTAATAETSAADAPDADNEAPGIDPSDVDAPPSETVPAPEAAPPASLARFELYRDRADQWRWRLVHRNGNIVAASGEGYSSDRSARRGMRSVMRDASGAAVHWER